MKDYVLHHKAEADTADLYPQIEDRAMEEESFLIQPFEAQGLAIEALRDAYARTTPEEGPQTSQPRLAVDVLRSLYDI